MQNDQNQEINIDIILLTIDRPYSSVSNYSNNVPFLVLDSIQGPTLQLVVISPAMFKVSHEWVH